MINTTLRGKPRIEDVTGKFVGQYVVVGPVGSDWRTSIYWVLRCRLCGAIRRVQRKDFCQYSKHANCAERAKARVVKSGR
jgi:hypothetical protein